MKIWEFCKEENNGKKYRDNEGEIWEVVKQLDTGGADLICESYRISESYYMSTILEMDFEEVIDWSKVPVDTKVLVSENGVNWHKRYFAKYEHGKVNAFGGGMTSWNAGLYNPWNYAKLWQEGEE